MSLAKASLLNSLAVAVKVGSAVILNKILAVYVGPAGYAVIGQFQNALAIIVSIAGGGIAAGVTKGTAERFDDPNGQGDIWGTALQLSLVASLVVGMVLVGFRSSLASWLLDRRDLGSIFVILAFTLPGIAANNILLGIINGKKEISLYITANIVGSLTSLAVIGYLAHRFSLYGTLVGCALAPSIIIFTTTALITRQDWFRWRELWGKSSTSSIKHLLGFGLMGVTSALTTPVSHILIREQLSTEVGLNATGYWQAIWKISEIYLMLVTTTLSIYYLPRIAEIREKAQLRHEVIKVYSVVMPIVIIGAMIIFLLREFIVRTLFTPDFLPMQELFPWQLIGDIIKIGSWITSCIMLGRSMVKQFIATEIIFSASFVGLSWFFVNRHGLVGVPIAYSVNYLFYWMVVALLVKGEFSGRS